MDDNKPSIRIPTSLMILDGIGILIVVLGALEMEGYIHIFEAWIPYEHYALAMIIFGALLILPVVIYLIIMAHKHNKPS